MIATRPALTLKGARIATPTAEPVTLFAAPSKMPCPSWSLPAHHACPSAFTEVHQAKLHDSDGWVYFRVHDSGDLFNIAYVACWTEIARALPGVKFWIPTRMWRFMDRANWNVALRELSALDNVQLKPSALYFDEPPPVIDGLGKGTGATTGTDTGHGVIAYTCHAPENNGECGDCRVSWTDSEVIYKAH